MQQPQVLHPVLQHIQAFDMCLTDAEHLMLRVVLTCIRRLSPVTLLRYRPGSRCRRWSG